jgi:hypothetical protein
MAVLGWLSATAFGARSVSSRAIIATLVASGMKEYRAAWRAPV